MIFDMVTNNIFKKVLEGAVSIGNAEKLNGQPASYYATAQSVTNITSGTAPAGDSDKLGGKKAGEYALAEQIKSNSLFYALTENFDLNNALGKYGTSNNTIVASLLNMPIEVTGGEVAIEWLPEDATNNCGVQKLYLYNVTIGFNAYKRAKRGTTWTSWERDATTADLEKYQPITKGNLATSIKEKALELPIGVYDFSLSGANYPDGVLPNTGYKYGSATVIKRSSNSITIVLWRGDDACPLATCYWGGSAWTEWSVSVTTADLANYLPNTGGDISNTNGRPLNLKGAAGSSLLGFKTSDGALLGSFGFRGADTPIVFFSDDAHYYNLLHDGNVGSYALPISGGKITNSVGTPLSLENTSNDNVYQDFFGASGFVGGIGFSGKDNFIVSGSFGVKQIHHDGNSNKVIVLSTPLTAEGSVRVW